MPVNNKLPLQRVAMTLAHMHGDLRAVERTFARRLHTALRDPLSILTASLI